MSVHKRGVGMSHRTGIARFFLIFRSDLKGNNRISSQRNWERFQRRRTRKVLSCSVSIGKPAKSPRKERSGGVTSIDR
jgi:hypothetical protein